MAKTVRETDTERREGFLPYVKRMVLLGEELSLTDIYILKVLSQMKEQKRDISIKGLARILVMDYSQVFKSLKKMEKMGEVWYFKGLVEFYDSEDLSTNYVRITDVGEAWQNTPVYPSEVDKTYMARLTKTLHKKNSKLIKPDILKNLIQEEEKK